VYQAVTILGNLGSDPELRRTPDGTPVTSFSVAVNKRWTTKDGQQGEKTVWFRVTAWRRLAETCAEYLGKGRLVLVEGEMQEARAYQGKDGEWRASLELVADTVKFVGGREEGGTTSGTTNGTISGADIAMVADDEVPF